MFNTSATEVAASHFSRLFAKAWLRVSMEDRTAPVKFVLYKSQTLLRKVVYNFFRVYTAFI